MSSVLIFLLALMLLAVVAFAAARWHAGAPAPRGPGDDDGGDDGGSYVRMPPDHPPGPPDGVEPAWWPQFERDLDDYMRDVGSRA